MLYKLITAFRPITIGILIGLGTNNAHWPTILAVGVGLLAANIAGALSSIAQQLEIQAKLRLWGNFAHKEG